MTNGDRYIGDFKDGKKHGTGMWFDSAKQTKQQVEFKNDKRVGWIGKPQSSYVSGYGNQANSDKTTPRTASAKTRLSNNFIAAGSLKN